MRAAEARSVCVYARVSHAGGAPAVRVLRHSSYAVMSRQREEC